MSYQLSVLYWKAIKCTASYVVAANQKATILINERNWHKCSVSVVFDSHDFRCHSVLTSWSTHTITWQMLLDWCSVVHSKRMAWIPPHSHCLCANIPLSVTLIVQKLKRTFLTKLWEGYLELLHYLRCSGRRKYLLRKKPGYPLFFRMLWAGNEIWMAKAGVPNRCTF